MVSRGPRMAHLRSPAALLLFLAPVLFAAYSPALRGRLLWDDDAHVTQEAVTDEANGLRRIWFELKATVQYYPLTYSAFWLQHRLWGDSTLGYHLVNLACHFLSAVLLWRILLHLRLPGALFCAAWFAVHPVHVESVAWITELKNCLSGVLYLGAALAYLRHWQAAHTRPMPARAWWWYALALLLFLLAVLSKTVACSLPAALLVLYWWQHGRLPLRIVAGTLPLFLIAVGAAALTVWMEMHSVMALGPDWDFTGLERFLIAGRSLWSHAARLVLPVELAFVYPRWHVDTGVAWQYLFPAGVAALVILLVVMVPRWGRGPLAAGLFYGGTLFPALGFFNVYPMRYTFYADHYQYLASIGMLALLTSLLVRLRRHPRSPAFLRKPAVGPAFLLLLAVLTWQRAHAFQDKVALWTDTLRKNPESFMARNNLGAALLARGAPAQAIPHLKRALELRSDRETRIRAGNNLGDAYFELGEMEQAIVQYRMVIELAPEHSRAQANLGSALAQQGQVDEALPHLRIACERSPETPAYRANLARALLDLNRAEAARAVLLPFLAEGKSTPVIQYLAGRASLGMADPHQALRHLEAARRAMPNDPFVLTALGHALRALERHEEARDLYTQALEVLPDLQEARAALAGLSAD